MPDDLHPAKKIYPAHGDPIRIVPLHLPDTLRQPTVEAAAAAPAAAPKLTYRNGPLLTAVEVFTIFWGPAWQHAPQSAMAHANQPVLRFHSDEPPDRSARGVQRARKGDRAAANGPEPSPSRRRSSSIRFPIPPFSICCSTKLPSNPAVPHPTPNTLYFVYLPPGVRVVQGGSASCQAFCGYHNDISGQIFYAAMPYPGCAGCTRRPVAHRRAYVDQFPRTVRGDHRCDPRSGVVRRHERGDR